MQSSKTHHHQQVKWWPVIVILVAFTAAQTYQTFRVPMLGGNDVHAKGSQLLKHLYPDLFQDEVFGSLEPERVHPPLFFIVYGGLTRLTGSPETALGLAVPIIYLVFMFGMFMLLDRIGIAWPVALGMTLLSTVAFYNIAGAWAFYYLYTAMPRNWHLAAFPWILLLGWPWLAETVRERPALQAASRGLAVGLAANLHPTSGYALAEVIGFLLLLRLIRGEIRLAHLGAYVLGSLAGVLPYLVHLYGRRRVSGAAPAGHVDFSRFVEVVNARIQYKFPYPILNLPGHAVPANQQVWLVWAYLALTLLFAFFFIKARKQGREPGTILWLCFGLFQLGMVGILTFANELIFIGLIYWIARTVSNRLDQIDRRLMEFLVTGPLLGFALGGWLLELLWRSTQAVGVTPWVTEQGRSIRLLFFPLLVFMARLGDWAWKRIGASLKVAVVLGGLLVFVLPSSDSPAWLVFALLVLALMSGDVSRENQPWWVEGLIVGAVGAIACHLLFEAFDLKQFDLHALLVGAAAGCAALMWRFFQRGKRRFRLGASLGVVCFGCAAALFVLPGGLSGQDVTLPTAIFQSVPDEVRQNWGFRRLNVNQAYLDEYELAQWAAHNTPEHSLFYHDDISFRFWSRRNLTHGWKEIALAINTGEPETAIALYDRYELFEAGYRDPALLKELVAENAVDYVVFQPDVHRMENLPDTWVVVFESDRRTVYQVIP
jgi:hypothetical protein